MTTGKVSRGAQLKAAQITAENKSRGLFIVEVKAWDEIVSLLNEYPEIMRMLNPGIQDETVRRIESAAVSIESAAQSLTEQARNTDSALREAGEAALGAETESSEASLIGVGFPDAVQLTPDTRRLARLLELYYPDLELRKDDLFRYSFTIDGRLIRTNIATSRSWIGLAIPIDPYAHDKFPLQESDIAWPSISKIEEAHLKQKLNQRRILFHNRPIFSLKSFSGRGLRPEKTRELR